MEASNKTNEKTMKALVLNADQSITLQDVPIPRPRDGEVLIKIMAAPINPSDIAFVKGFYSSQKPVPCTPGFEGSGIVVQNGGGIIGWHMVNKRVALTVQSGFNGTYGQYAVASSQEVMPIPSELTLEAASMSFVNPLTAITMLQKVKAANIKAIVHTAAASSLGRMMNRLFNSEGIPIINVVRRDEQIELLKKQGAKHVLNSEKQGFEQQLKTLCKKLNATLCYDAVAGQVTTKILRALPRNSSIEIYGAMSQSPTISGLEIREILFGNKIIKGFWLTEELKDLGLFSKLKLINKLGGLLKNELKSTIAKEVSLDKFNEGLEYYMNNMTEGKVIVKPWLGYEEEKKEKEVKKGKEEKKKEEKKQKKKEEKQSAPVIAVVESTLTPKQQAVEVQPESNPVPVVEVEKIEIPAPVSVPQIVPEKVETPVQTPVTVNPVTQTPVLAEQVVETVEETAEVTKPETEETKNGENEEKQAE